MFSTTFHVHLKIFVGSTIFTLHISQRCRFFLHLKHAISFFLMVFILSITGYWGKGPCTAHCQCVYSPHYFTSGHLVQDQLSESVGYTMV